MRSKRSILFFAVLLSLALVQQSYAALKSVGPVTEPFPKAFPSYYEDFGIAAPSPDARPPMALGLCDPFDPICSPLIPLPGEPFPDELFWFTAEATITSGVTTALLVLAVEAAYDGTGAAVSGQEISFTRIRVRVKDLPAGGLYEVIHPYGVLNLQAEDNGKPGAPDWVINYTNDVGIGAPGTFSGALSGVIGPFLMAASPAARPAGYIADVGTPTTVTGSPVNTNFFRVRGLDAGNAAVDFTTDLFTVGGKIALPLKVESANFTRTAGLGAVPGITQINLFAHSATTATLNADLGPLGVFPLSNIDPTDPTAPALDTFFSSQLFLNPPALPTQVTVTATDPSVTDPSTHTVDLADLVTITRAEYDVSTKRLIIEASSSDKVGLPVLTAELPAGPQPLVAGILDIPNFPGFPPPTVKVTSALKGSDTQQVTVVQSPPFAISDQFTIRSGDPALTANVLDNDILDALEPVTVTFGPLTPLNFGTFLGNPDGSFSFAAPAGLLATTQVSFQYTVTVVSSGATSAATVSITVGPANNPPVAADSTATVASGRAVNFTLSATDSDGTIDWTTLTFSNPTGGALAHNGGGAMTYTARPDFAGADSFTWSVADNMGTVSNTATVSITVTNTAPRAVNDGPAVFDPSVTPSVTINVVNNDIDPEGNLDPASVTIVADVSFPAKGTVVANGDGTITYTSGQGQFGGDQFKYTVSDLTGAVSNQATVIARAEVPEVLTITNARGRGNTWNIAGNTSNVTRGNNITLYAGPDTTGPVIGRALPTNRGRWLFRGDSIPVGSFTQVTAESKFGHRVTVRLRP